MICSGPCKLLRWLSGKESACNAGDVGLISGSGKSSGEGNGNLLQYSCLENPMDRGAMDRVHGVTKRVGLNLVTTQRAVQLADSQTGHSTIRSLQLPLTKKGCA